MENGIFFKTFPKTVTMKNCKTVTTMSCVNQFFSFLALVGCSDRSVRVYDLNQGKVLRSLANCHSRPVYSILHHERAVPHYPLRNDAPSNLHFTVECMQALADLKCAGTVYEGISFEGDRP